MCKKILFILCCSIAVYLSPLKATNPCSDSTQTTILGVKKIAWLSHFHQNIQICLGFDLEPTHSTRLDHIGIKPIVNLGIGYQFKLNDRWAIRPEIWYQQFSTPSISVITDDKFNPNGLRIHSVDTTTLLRMSGLSTGLVIKRKLIAGFSLLGGVQCAWYKKGVQESGYFVSDLTGATSRGYTSSFPGYKTLPSWINGFQPGLKIGVEKVFGKRIVLGFNIYQTLKDLTDFPDGQKNYSMNFLGYLGVRI
jgi:hypothetical protein